MLVTHNDIPLSSNQKYKIISPIAVEYNSNQYRPDEALADLEDKANSIGANAIIGFSWSPIPIISKNASNNMMAQGTAVLLISSTDKKNNTYNNEGEAKHEN